MFASTSIVVDSEAEAIEQAKATEVDWQPDTETAVARIEGDVMGEEDINAK